MIHHPPGLTRRAALRLLAAALPAGSALPGLHRLANAQSAPNKPRELIVRAWGGVWVAALEEGVSNPFSAATGIRVRHDLTEDNEIQPKIWAAVAQGRRPPLNVNWDTSTNATKSALRGVCVPLDDLPNLEGLLPVAKPAGLEGYPLVNTYSYVYVLAYRREAFPDAPPDSWRALLDPRFKGRIALYDDGIGFHPSAQIAGGGTMAQIPDDMEPCWEFVKAVKAQDPLLGEDADFTNWFQQGEIDLACTILSNARQARQNGIDVAWTVPVEGAKVDTDGMWVPQGLSDEETYWSKQYVNYALSLEAQGAWCAALGLPPVRPGIEPPADLAGDPAYPDEPADFDKLLSVPTPILVEHESDWFARFNEIMQG
ncbi:MAG: PotD/PotF family extracellular solute-binding protein [Candidatus Competibacterales bacterium]